MKKNKSKKEKQDKILKPTKEKEGDVKTQGDTEPPPGGGSPPPGGGNK